MSITGTKLSNLISIILPISNEPNNRILNVLKSIDKQSLQADEIIIINTGAINFNIDACEQLECFRKITLFHRKGLYPGAARNLGISVAKNNILAFLDANTHPSQDWLKEGLSFLTMDEKKIIIGKTIFNASSYFQKLVRACSYGRIIHETVPGTILRKNIAEQLKFREDVRAGEDIDWKNKIGLLFQIDANSNSVIFYNGFPENLIKTIKKYTTYSFFSAMLEIQRNIKDLYFTLVLILSALLIPRWNYYLDGWDNNPLYIDDISKKYLLLICTLFLIYSVMKQFLNRSFRHRFFEISLKTIIFIGISLLIFNWNRLFANWVESAIMYIPHITKIYLISLISISFLARGLYIPWKKKEDLSFLLPFNWLLVGSLGLLIDLIKLPGYLLGAFRSIFFQRI